MFDHELLLLPTLNDPIRTRLLYGRKIADSPSFTVQKRPVSDAVLIDLATIIRFYITEKQSKTKLDF